MERADDLLFYLLKGLLSLQNFTQLSLFQFHLFFLYKVLKLLLRPTVSDNTYPFLEVTRNSISHVL